MHNLLCQALLHELLSKHCVDQFSAEEIHTITDVGYGVWPPAYMCHAKAVGFGFPPRAQDHIRKLAERKTKSSASVSGSSSSSGPSLATATAPALSSLPSFIPLSARSSSSFTALAAPPLAPRRRRTG